MNTGPRVIAHVDMDAFFASVEQRDNPELRGKPVLVGGSAKRGVVSAASYEARPFGVHSAMPMAQALRLCPQAVVLPGRMAAYAEASGRIMDVFRSFTPLVEPLSLDEAFLDLTGAERLHGPAREAARAIKRRIREETGLTASVGIGPAKFIAKIASDLRKPDGLVEVLPEEVDAFLAPMSIERLWG
ncbi:MAG: DNA polymerase IV, partial [Candidatus Methylomirabilis sp.]|nr:DNA polymerase IV [Deltaproteobacteria bacterium]